MCHRLHLVWLTRRSAHLSGAAHWEACCNLPARAEQGVPPSTLSTLLQQLSKELFSYRSFVGRASGGLSLHANLQEPDQASARASTERLHGSPGFACVHQMVRFLRDLQINTSIAAFCLISERNCGSIVGKRNVY